MKPMDHTNEPYAIHQAVIIAINVHYLLLIITFQTICITCCIICLNNDDWQYKYFNNWLTKLSDSHQLWPLSSLLRLLSYGSYNLYQNWQKYILITWVCIPSLTKKSIRKNCVIMQNLMSRRWITGVTGCYFWTNIRGLIKILHILIIQWGQF